MLQIGFNRGRVRLKDEEKVPLVTLNMTDFDMRLYDKVWPPMMKANRPLNPTEQWSILGSGNVAKRIEVVKYFPSEETLKKLTSASADKI